MALVRYPQYDKWYGGDESSAGTHLVAYVDTSTGQIFNELPADNGDSGPFNRMIPTEMTWDYMNTADASGKNIYGSSGYVPEEFKSYGDESGDSWGAQGKAGVTPSGDIQIAESLISKGYNDVLNKYGIQPKYDPEYGYVLPPNIHRAVTQEYFKNYGLGDYSSRGGITGFLDNYAVPLMMAATGAGMAGLGGVAATEAGAGAAAAEGTAGLATAETAAAAGDAYLPGALSNPLTQAMPTVSNLAQAAATNAGMQLATTGTIDPEKVLESVVTGAAGSTLGNLAGIAAGNALDSNLVRSIVSGAVSGATQAAINGTDPVTSALASGAASGLGYEARENNINVPQQSINAVVSSVATGAPLEKTLLSAAMSMGVGAAKDAVSNISLTDTQAPAPVETRTPISPLPADSGNITTAELSDTSPSGYYASGSDVPVNADGSIYSGLSATGGGTNVAASNLPINIETQPEGYFDSEGAFRPLYQQADGSLKNESGDTVNQQGEIIKTPSRGFWGTANYGNAQPTNSNIATTNTADANAHVIASADTGTTTDVTAGTTGVDNSVYTGGSGAAYTSLQSAKDALNDPNLDYDPLTGQIFNENLNLVGIVSDAASSGTNLQTTVDTKTAVGFNDYSDLVYQTADGIFVDSSNNPVAAPSTKLDGTPFNDTRSGTDAGNTTVNPVNSGLSTVTGSDGAGSILDGSVAGDGTITADQGRTGTDAVFYNDNLSGLNQGSTILQGDVINQGSTILQGGMGGDGTTPIVTTTVTPANNTTNTSTTTTGSGTTPASAAEKARAIDMAPTYAYLQPTMLTTGKAGSSMPLFTGLDPKLASILNRAKGGAIHPQLQRVLSDRGYNPVEMVAGPEDRYYARHAKRGFAVTGPGTGQSDDIPTMLADSEYVIDADTVAALGDGSSKAGAEVLDKMRMAIRKHKRSAPINKIPPKAKSPLDYITEGMKMNAKKK